MKVKIQSILVDNNKHDLLSLTCMEESAEVARTKLSKIKPIQLAIVLIIIAAIFLPSFYFYNQYKQSQLLLQNPNLIASQGEKDLVTKVGKLIELPVGESPTIASVKDKTQLPNIPLFANAQNGDQILIYPKAQKAILYRPSENKIIEVSPVTINNQAPTGLPTPSVTTYQRVSPTPFVSTVPGVQ